MIDITVIEDDEILRDYLCVILQRAGYRVRPYRDLPLAEDILSLHQPRVIISDIFLPSGNGLKLLEELRETVPDTKVVVMSSDKKALRNGAEKVADATLSKPFTAEEFMATLNAL